MRHCRKLTTIFVSAALALLLFGPARAAEEMTVLSDQSAMLQLEKEPATIVIGNPSIVDVQSEGSHLLILGRGFGLTNVVLLDDKGNIMREIKVRVGLDDPYSVAVFDRGDRQSYSCAPTCEPSLQVGDDLETVRSTYQRMDRKATMARDQAQGGQNNSGMNFFTFPFMAPR